MVTHAMFGFFVAAITNRRHQILPLESATDSVINTLWLSPVWLQLVVAIALMADESFHSLLNDFLSIQRCRRHAYLSEKVEELVKYNLLE